MRRKALIFAILLLLATGIFADPPTSSYDRSNARGNQLVLRVAASDAQAVATQYGLTLLAEMTAGAAHLALTEGPESMTAEQIEDLIRSDLRVQSHGRAYLASLPGIGASHPADADPSGLATDLARSGDFPTPCLSQHFPTAPWSGYADQAAARLIRLHEAQTVACGSATVAVIDTGVDPDHPALANALLSGYDFLLGQEGIPSEWDFLDGSFRPILDEAASSQTFSEADLIGSFRPILDSLGTTVIQGQGEVVILNSSIAPIVDPAAVADIEEMSLPPFFGHGTMVAGLIRLTAPGARIMPIRVFDSYGTAHLFDILAAIYYAVDHGADVISMSFSISESSSELREAILYARSRGVVCVAAAGNDHQRTLVYPAAYSAAIGVAATDLEDQLSPFSNYGAALADLAAPGSGVISTFPGGLYAAGWGTSFSAPLVAGTAALIHPLNPGGNAAAFQSLAHDLSFGSVILQDLAGEIGGRLDMLGAVSAAAD